MRYFWKLLLILPIILCGCEKMAMPWDKVPDPTERGLIYVACAIIIHAVFRNS